MLTLCASRRSGGGVAGPRRGRRRGVTTAGWVVGGGLALLAATTLVGLQRLRATAARFAHDLDRTGSVGQGRGEPVRLVVLGDSAARGYGLTDAGSALPQQVAGRMASATGRRVTVTSLATDGQRTVDVLAHQVPHLRGMRPDAVVVSVGVNDVLGRTPDRVVTAGTRDLLTSVVAACDRAAVVLVPCPDLSAAPGFPRPLNRMVGWRGRRIARLQEAVARELGVPVVPLPRPEATMFGPDGFHPGAAGHAAMADVVAEVLLHADGAPHAAADGEHPDPRTEITWT